MEAAKRDNFLNNGKKRVLIVVSAFFLLYLVAYVIDPFDSYWKEYFTRSTPEILEDWAITLISCVVITESSIFISSRLNQQLPWTERPGKRFAIESSLNFAVILLLHLIITLFCVYSDSDKSSVIGVNASIEETRGMLQWIVASTMIAFVIIAVNTGNYLILNWKNASLKAAELNQVAMEAELQSLKLQIDPHFVFNNLSVLSELILEDQQLGYEYAENFSRIYRYLLVNAKKNTISLQEELKFLHSYIFLITHRFGEAVHFNIEVDDESKQLHMPPLTLQLLVENALKHNRTNKKEPLQVNIYTNDQQELIVENILLPVEKTMDSSGIGIRNIIRRYHLLSEKEPKILQDETTFKVVIPLIKFG